MSKNIGKVTLYDVSTSLLQKSPEPLSFFYPRNWFFSILFIFIGLWESGSHLPWGKSVQEESGYQKLSKVCKWNITSICSRKRPQQRLFKDTCFGILLKIPAKFYQQCFYQLITSYQYTAQKGQIIIANLSVLSWKGILHSLWCLPSKITGRIRPSSDAKLSLICSEKS